MAALFKLMRRTVKKACTKLTHCYKFLIMSVADFSQDAGVSPVLTRVSPEQICKYWEKHVADAAIFVRLW